jgi:hypothetical protein
MVKLANMRERSDVLDVFPKGSRQAVHFGMSTSGCRGDVGDYPDTFSHRSNPLGGRVGSRPPENASR